MQKSRVRDESMCSYTDEQVQASCKRIVVYFALFLLVHCLVHIRQCCGAALEMAEQQNTGAIRVLRLMVHAPLFILVMSSLLLGVQLLSSRRCREQNPELYRAIGSFACLSCLVSACCLFLVAWQAALSPRPRRLRPPGREKRAAPPGTIDQIRRLPYDPELFGDEDDKRYAGACPICLGEWAEQDDIRVPILLLLLFCPSSS
ncbi:unnamed protein product [Prorocentrum cordatum]|uniref:Uncharacterized protein n=1 Tax=Prorocentrum cordatum TaxID=2364126 RepID=A0ABN9WFS0_9DINO|nr:unnamed protein product [Polarella glacialis]